MNIHLPVILMFNDVHQGLTHGHIKNEHSFFSQAPRANMILPSSLWNLQNYFLQKLPHWPAPQMMFYICLYMFICIRCIYIYVYVCIIIYMYIYMYRCMYNYLHIYKYIYIYIYTYIHIYIYTYIHIHIPTYLPTYIHTYIHICIWWILPKMTYITGGWLHMKSYRGFVAPVMLPKRGVGHHAHHGQCCHKMPQIEPEADKINRFWGRSVSSLESLEICNLRAWMLSHWAGWIV